MPVERDDRPGDAQQAQRRGVEGCTGAGQQVGERLVGDRGDEPAGQGGRGEGD
ncbi:MULTISPECIES: hypothetical protein [unclassified Pseudonocardia]|uniref:hypothetical protein n=1 Tax=unclassified Pseudonocardia TaxID=2619320 RepID=UPI0025D86B7E|nr:MULTISPECIES: hypothetical protein [unclassified Pseudonocardia]